MRVVNTKPGSKVQFSSKELLFLGQSGQPYRGSVYVEYTTDEKTVNLLDIKKYITSLRNETIVAEDIAQVIHNEFDGFMVELGVVVDLTARGGIAQSISYGNEFSPLRDRPNIFQV